MSLETELDGLARTLVPRGARGLTVMVAPVTPGAGASFVACGLARRSARLNANAVWLYDLDFVKNPLTAGLSFTEDAYDGALNGSQFWRCEPAGAGRLALRRPEGSRVWLSRFERAPGAVRRVVFQPSSAYWEQARRACALAILDAPSGSPAITALARDMDGVILVGDARATRRSQADALAAQIEAAGGRVLGVIVNRVQMRAAS